MPKTGLTIVAIIPNLPEKWFKRLRIRYKLCNISKDFEKFIEQTEKLLTANERYITSTEKELIEFCDEYFVNETDIIAYCKEKNIPIQ